MNTRINVIMNGRQELKSVVSNLRALFESEDTVLLYTKSEKSEVMDVFSEILGIDGKRFESEVYYEKFNEVDYSAIKSDGIRKFVCIRMPNSLFRTIPTAYNDAFKFVDGTECAKFMHMFSDDCKIVDGCGYDPLAYEWYMETFDEKFIMDSKTNQGNFAFKKYSPRFVFLSKTYLKHPISFCQFESKEHFIVNRLEFKQMFDEKIKRLYIPEFVIRANKSGVVRHTSFYPDPVLEKYVERDESLPYTQDVKRLSDEYAEDEKYIRDELGESIHIENNIDPIVAELSSVINGKLKKAES